MFLSGNLHLTENKKKLLYNLISADYFVNTHTIRKIEANFIFVSFSLVYSIINHMIFALISGL